MLLQIGRIAVIVITLFATLMALNPDNSVLQLVAYAWAGFGAAFGPIILLSVYWKSLNGQAALAGIVTGGITAVIWKNIPNTHVLFDLYELVPRFILGMFTIIIVQKYCN